MAIFWTNVDVDLKPLTHNELSVSVTKEIITGVMTVLIWGALVLEFFLAAWIGSSSPTPSIATTTNVPFSENGAAKNGKKYAPTSMS